MRHLVRLNNLRVILEIQTFLQKILQTTDVIKGVRRLVRVGFVPNPRPTLQNQVEEVQTHCRSMRESDRSGWIHVGKWLVQLKPSMVEKSG